MQLLWQAAAQQGHSYSGKSSVRHPVSAVSCAETHGEAGVHLDCVIWHHLEERQLRLPAPELEGHLLQRRLERVLRQALLCLVAPSGRHLQMAIKACGSRKVQLIMQTQTSSKLAQ